MSKPGPSKVDFLPTQIPQKKEYAVDITTLSKPQLLELLDRQNRLLSSPALSKLRDKGEKVKLLKKQIEDALEKLNKSCDLSDELTKLSINEKKVDVIEWGEKEEHENDKEEIHNNNLIEDEQNPLVLIATHSGTIHHQRIIKKEKPEEPLITLEDIEEVYALELCNKIDKAEPKQRFLPHKTLISPVDGMKQYKTRDLSAATPPNPVFGDVKFITLEESVKLQYEQAKHLKEVQLKHATERLKDSRFKMRSDLPSSTSMGVYREQTTYNEEESEEENSENDE